MKTQLNMKNLVEYENLSNFKLSVCEIMFHIGMEIIKMTNLLVQFKIVHLNS